jgi:hypothetical protein
MRVNLWRNELKNAIREILKERDMTVSEICDKLKRVYKVIVPYQALNSILAVTDGVFVCNIIHSLVGKKMVNLYTLGRIRKYGELE